MIRWAFLLAGAFAFGLMIAYGPQVAIFATFGLLFGNFATFCLQYDGAMERARARVEARLGILDSKTDAYQRISSAVLKPTPADRMHPRNLMSTLNLITGIACVGIFVWGVVLWMQ